MNYIQAKYPNSNRTYTYRTEDNIAAGDTVVNDKGAKLTVVGEADMAWVETYGADKVAVVKKYVESEAERYGAIETVNILNDFIGKSFTKVENVNNEQLVFHLEDGTKYIFYHKQDCCEVVTIEDICGNLGNLENSPIAMAEEVCHERVEEYGDDGETYTFYKFATVKGYVTVRWCGASNGYYSEHVDFKIVEPVDAGESED